MCKSTALVIRQNKAASSHAGPVAPCGNDNAIRIIVRVIGINTCYIPVTVCVGKRIGARSVCFGKSKTAEVTDCVDCNHITGVRTVHIDMHGFLYPKATVAPFTVVRREIICSEYTCSCIKNNIIIIKRIYFDIAEPVNK